MKTSHTRAGMFLALCLMMLAAIPASATLFTWSQTAGDNTTADSTINWQEGQSPGSVNDSARAMMAAVAKYRDDLAGVKPSNVILTVTGTGAAYTATTNQTFTSLTNGATVTFKVGSGLTNTGAVTLNVDSLGAVALRSVSGADLTSGSLVEGSSYTATYHQPTNEWIVRVAPSADSNPVGTVLSYAGSSAPTGYLLMYGQCVSRTTYATLFAVIGTTYDSGCSGSDFGIPDMRGRVAAGDDNMGGSSANRLANVFDGDTLGNTGGAEQITLTEAQLASHDHGKGTLAVGSGGGDNIEIPRRNFEDTGASDNQRLSLANDNGTAGTFTVSQDPHTHSLSGSTADAGSDQPHNNVQPTIILTYIIKF